MFVRNLSTLRVVYLVNFFESFDVGSLGLP